MLGIGSVLSNVVPTSVYFMGIIAVFSRIDLSLILLIFLIPFTNILQRLQQFPLGNQYIDIILLAILFKWIINSLSGRNKLLEKTPFNFLVVILAIFTYIELWLGSSNLGLPSPISILDPRVQTWKNYVILPLLFLITLNAIKDKKKMRWLVYAMVIAILLAGYYFFKDYRWIGKEMFREEKRDIGTFVYLGPNEWGAFHAHYLFVILGLLLIDRLKPVWKIIFGSAIFLSLYSVLFSYSRGAYTAVVVGLLLIGLFKNKIVLIGVLVLLICWNTLLPPAVVQRIDQTKNEEGEYDATAQERLGLWQMGMQIFSQNPVTGLGFNTMPYVGLGGYTDTHNIYVKTLAEQGIIGITIFLLILFFALKSGWQLYRKANDTFLKGLGFGFLVCTLSLMITNFFGDRWTYLQVGAYFWVFLALVVRGNIIVNSEINSKIAKNKAI